MPSFKYHQNTSTQCPQNTPFHRYDNAAQESGARCKSEHIDLSRTPQPEIDLHRNGIGHLPAPYRQFAGATPSLDDRNESSHGHV